MLSPEERALVVGTVQRELGVDIANKLASRLDDQEETERLVRVSLADAQMREAVPNAITALETLAAAQLAKEERWGRIWESLLSPQGLIALLIGGAVTLGAAYLGASSHEIQEIIPDPVSLPIHGAP